MSISFAGINLLLDSPDGKSSEWIDRYLSLDDLRIYGVEPIARYNNQLPIPYPNFSALPPMRFNSLYWPTGASRWAFGLFLVDTPRIDAIIDIISGGSQSQARNAGAQLVIADSDFSDGIASNDFTADSKGRVALSTEMFALPPRPISPVAYSDGLWILPLVDIRYYWQWKNTGDFDASDVGECGTWDDVFLELEEELGVSLTWDEVHANYDSPDTEYLKELLSYANAGVVMDAVSNSVGQRFARWIDGTAYSIDAPASEERLTNNLDGNLEDAFKFWNPLCGDDFSLAHQAAAKPERVVVAFNNTCSDTWNDIERTADSLSVQSYVAGMKKLIRVLSSDPFTGGTPTSVSIDHAARIATDFYAWLENRYDRSFSSVKAWNTTGFDDYAIWEMGRLREDGAYSAQTRVSTVPYNMGIESVLPICGVPASNCICDFIRFTIVGMTVTNTVALVDVDSEPCGCDKVPEGELTGQVLVTDALGCIFNESDDELEGRKGYAKYMNDPEDPENDCQWEVVMLCCADECA